MKSPSFYYRFGKRVLDVALSLTGLVISGTPMLVIALGIRTLDGKPLFFRQERVGRHGKLFLIRKFRTMGVQPSVSASVTVSGDPRITRVGQWLRRWKLDELPQLLNVLRGDMSLVGPRPDMPGYADRLAGDEARLLQLRPGITGLATLVFRDEEELLAQARDPMWFNDEVLFPAKVRINLEYLDRVSLFEDIRLILLTILPFRVNHPERERVEQALQPDRCAKV